MSIITRIIAWIMAAISFIFPWLNKEEPKDPETYIIQDKSVTFFLKSNPSTGYTWAYDVYGTGLKFESEKFDVSDDPNLVGAPGITEIRFIADGEGEFEIVFQYLRPWDNRMPDKKFSVTGKTDKNGNIIITGQDGNVTLTEVKK